VRGEKTKSGRGPLKSLGQNFLVDGNTIDRIIRSAALTSTDSVLEIGPGRGALTRRMCDLAGRMVLVEYDHLLAGELSTQFQDNPCIRVIDGDILAVDLKAMLDAETPKWKVVANLPYNISTEVLFRLLEVRDRVSRMVLMLQKEVGERLAARPGNSDYGVTTVLLGLWFDIRMEFVVPPGCFNPRPKVDSAVLSFTPLDKPRVEVGSEDIFRRVVKAAFSMRRKTLLNCLKSSGLAEGEQLPAILEACGIDGRRRGETLTMEEFGLLSRRFSSQN